MTQKRDRFVFAAKTNLSPFSRASRANKLFTGVALVAELEDVYDATFNRLTWLSISFPVSRMTTRNS